MVLDWVASEVADDHGQLYGRPGVRLTGPIGGVASSGKLVNGGRM
ncbi:hypothetical protein J2S90_000234 [Arthrobacter bambusae]|uniref:Uncharacterized protein n=1 Tax=Arthrobacter bambusae TaxID=1338426 RepID=A0AAW8DDP5_9MICC|nr:hypothetical protein [Arthrobacter bambusae]MDQ0128712.1 hypothetical protein [Arthrobacter bambusae]MDQ0180053.1 hypothetical protein [Arthrobacter bambusae]